MLKGLSLTGIQEDGEGLGFERLKWVRGVSKELSKAMVGWIEKQMVESFALKRELNGGTKRKTVLLGFKYFNKGN